MIWIAVVILIVAVGFAVIACLIWMLKFFSFVSFIISHHPICLWTVNDFVIGSRWKRNLTGNHQWPNCSTLWKLYFLQACRSSFLPKWQMIDQLPQWSCYRQCSFHLCLCSWKMFSLPAEDPSKSLLAFWNPKHESCLLTWEAGGGYRG